MILRGMYRMLLRLRPREWRGEMLGVFEQARVDARAHGWFSYVAFGMRELAGMVSLDRTAVARVWPWAIGGAIVGLLAGGVTLFFIPEVYTSKAKILMLQGSIHERFTPGAPALSVESFHSAQQVALSRNSVENLIRTYDLFGPELRRMPLEDVIELTQRATEIKPTNEDKVLRVSFSYRDPLVAQRVVRALQASLIDQTSQQRLLQSKLTVEFLNRQAEHAAAKWEELSAAAARSAGQTSERARLDVDLAKQRYVTLRQQLAEAELVAALEEGKQAATVEVLDLPTLPEHPDLGRGTILGVSALIGLVIGWVAGLIRRLRLTPVAAPDMIGV